MSEQQLSYGFIVPLLMKVNYKDLNDHLEKQPTNIKVNYEGSLLYTDTSNKDDIYGGMNIIDLSKVQQFVDDCEILGLEIDDTKVRAYCSSWYNGADSYMDDYKLSEFYAALS